MRGHVVADEEALAFHDDVGWWLVRCSAIRWPNRDQLSRVYFDGAMELEEGFVVAAATNQLPTANLSFLKELNGILATSLEK